MNMLSKKILLLLALTLIGCIGTRKINGIKENQQSDKFFKKPIVKPTLIAPGDTLQIIVFNERELSGEFQVLLDGKIFHQKSG